MPDFDDQDFDLTLYNKATFNQQGFDARPQIDDDNDTFAQAIQGVTPLKQDKVDLRSKGSMKKNADKAYHRDQAVQDTMQVADGLSSESVDIVESDQALNFAANGVQLKLIKRLQKGHLPWEQGIDLHGLSIDEARNQLSHFIRSCFYQHCQSVLVIHGKAYSQSGSMPLLKSYTNDWLRQLPEVLAFSSAQAKDGGTGAVYVLLKRKR
jgi:DNA-nicking Smr family endonuclease